MATSYLIVRAEVADPADRDAFDRWYETDHLTDAAEAFGALRAWRGWSDVDTSVHYAYYEFDHVERARAVMESAALQRLVVEFDRTWGRRVTRVRDVVRVAQRLSG